MDKIAKLPMQERQELIIATASKMKISEAIVEKDFWVCFCLDYLFHECKWKEAYRPEDSKIPDRYSRHYYDLYCMAGTEVLDKALAQADLLEQVAEFKRKFYPRNWAKYELARMDSIKLMPAEHSIKRLEADYGVMRAMIYGDYPKFEDVLKRLQELEETMHLMAEQ